MPTPPASTSPYLIRISKNFEHLADEIIADLGAKLTKRLGEEYFLIQTPDKTASSAENTASYIRWKLPIDHAWPCNPEKMEGFIEKAAQPLANKFGDRNLQGMFIGRLNPSSGRTYFKSLATNLRGRTISLLANQHEGINNPEDQDPIRASLFCLLGKEGLYCGMISPRDANGFYPGGTKFISQKTPHTISRAGAKIAEALHYLKLHQELPEKGGRWLELGVCPGGMTSELLERGFQVTAVDRAPLDSRLDGRDGLSFIKKDVAKYQPPGRKNFDAILCDMNGDVQKALDQVIRLSRRLRAKGLVVFTLKTPGATSYDETNDLFRTTIASADSAGLKLVAGTHLTYNRHEFTLFFERVA